MASPLQERLTITVSSGKVRSPGSRVLEASTPVLANGKSPLSDDAIWKRLRESGFDEESIKRRDKASLIAYIAKLESEIFDYQHHMGLFILEKKEWVSKYEQVKASSDSAELTRKRDQAAHLSALAEARKREESLKKALGVEKECIANIEKALHEMRVESAETKVAAESKMSEARNMVEDAMKKLTEAETKLHAAESLQAEASRYHSAADRKLQEVEAREDEIRRRLISFKSDCDAKEKEISRERESLSERQKILQDGQERLLDGQALLNQREEYIFGRSQELNRLEKSMEASKAKIEKELRALNEEKSNLNLNMDALSTREEALIKSEALLNKKEQELLILQEKLASKKYDEIQRLMAEHEAALVTKKSEFESELELKRKFVEDEMEAKRRAFELREVDLNQKEELIQEREQDLEVQSRALLEKERDAVEKLKLLEEKEQTLNATEKEAQIEKINLQKEREEIKNMKLDLQKFMDSLERKRKQVDQAQEKLEVMKTEREELLVLEMKLKEEIDNIRAQKLELMVEAEQLTIEKAKFETEWELIDEKREELQKEAALVAEEKTAISKFLKEERESLKLEKDALREQFKQEVESLSREREAFVSKMEHEHSEWFSKIQQERAGFVLDIELQKSELENCIDKRREEIESYLREKEREFELEKNKELQYISHLKETVAKELEHVSLEMRKLDNERIDINLDREQREKECSELKKSIEELQVQREKLKKQRELLHADREQIHVQIRDLKKLEDLKTASENFFVSKIEQPDFKSRRVPVKKSSNVQATVPDVKLDSHSSKEAAANGFGQGLPSMQGSDNASPPSSAPFSWIKRCAEMIFKNSPEKLSISELEDVNLNFPEIKHSQNNKKVVPMQLGSVEDTPSISEQQRSEGNGKTDRNFSGTQPGSSFLEEPKVILEVLAVSENVRGTHNLEPETTDTTDNSLHSFPEQGLMSGRKRVKNPASNDHFDAQLEQTRGSKKRRQHKDATEILIDETTTNCVVSTQLLSPDDEHGLASSDMAPGGVEETSCFIDKNHIVPPEVTFENVDTGNSGEQAKLICLQNTVPELDQASPQSGEPDGHTCSPRVVNDLSSHGSRTKVQEVLLEADKEPAKEHGQSTEGC